MAKKTSKKPAASESNIPAGFTGGAPSNLKLPEGATVKRAVTLPSFAIKEQGVQRNFFIHDAMRVSKITQKAGASEADKKREPATVCTVTDIDTGEQGIYIVSSVVKANLERDYPEAGYVGKAFAIINKGKRSESQRYNDFGIYEIETPESQKLAAAMGK